MGSMNLMGIRSISCMRPCRCCMIKRTDLWDVTCIDCVNLRNSTECKELLDGAFEACCTQLRGEYVSEDGLNQLAECTRQGIHPVEIALLSFESPHKFFSAYLLAPTDLLHTLLSGLFRDWIVYVVILGKNDIFYHYTCKIRNFM